MDDVMMTMKMHVNESEMLTQTRSTALKKMNETLMRCTKNCLTNMDPHGTRQDLDCGLVFIQSFTAVMRTLQIFQLSRNLKLKNARSH